MRFTGSYPSLCLFHSIILLICGCNGNALDLPETSGGISDAHRESSSLPTPEAVVSLSHDFGTVETNSLLTHTFDVKNDSRSEWNIVDKIVPCSCSKVSLSKTTVPPGDSFSVAVEIKSGDRNRDFLIPITLNLQNQKMIQLNYHAFIRQLMPLNVNTLTFNENDKSQVEKRIVVRNFSGIEWKSLTLEPANDLVLFKTSRLESGFQDEKASPLETWQIKATPSSVLFSQSEKTLSFTITATGVDDSKIENTLYCLVRHEYPLRVVPDKVFVIGHKDKVKSVTKEFIVTSNTKIDDTLFSAVDSSDFVEVTQIAKLTPFKRKVSLKILPNKAKLGTNQSHVSLTYNDRKVEVPVSVFINDTSGRSQ